MTGPLNKLTDTKIEKRVQQAAREAAAGKARNALLGDGGGLTLQLTKTGGTSWLFRFTRDGRTRAMGLGPYPAISLKKARELASVARTVLAEGGDPFAEREAGRGELAALAKAKTFKDCADDYIDAHLAEWKNPKHVQQWRNTLSTYAHPVIGDRAVQNVTTADVRKILSPIWVEKNETANRLRGRIEAILDWATAHDLRHGDNPARWKGHLEHLLARSTPRSRAVVHHAALPYKDAPAFMAQLRRTGGMARWALEFLILTAARTSEVAEAQWSEIDWEAGMWVVPAARMKAGKEHRVPLVPRAMEVLKAVEPFKVGLYVFPGTRRDRPLSNMAMAAVLRRMKRTDITVHGFRSTFRDFVADETSHDFHTAEAALAHKLQDKVAAAYARTDLLEKRLPMMLDWMKFLSTKDDQ